MIVAGTRVRLHPRPLNDGRGVGDDGVVVGVSQIDTSHNGTPYSITGGRARQYTRLNIRLDSGELVSREPHEVAVEIKS